MVVACGSNSARDLVSFFRIPSEYDNHKQFNKLASERRKAWINRLKRADLTESKIKNGRICSKHFISGLRLDGRRANELRRIRCKLGVFTQPDGSAYLEQGLTKSISSSIRSTSGFTYSKYNGVNDFLALNPYSMAVFSTNERKKRPRGDRKSTELSMHLQQALLAVVKTELYPWSQIDVYVEVLHADGGIYPACVNAATLALIDAGIPIKEYVCACTASLANNNIPMLDISHQEEIIGGPTLTVAALPMSEKALQGCRDIRQILDEAVRLHVRDVGSSTGWAGTG
ncbi:hypothetical protein NQ317_003233 [Molorchus minor]|uniref:Uncharacterized protein n=1 Tax=Molorchus minor TaxID=1323400 RepID=A0ABQ9JEJ4_9CUCU|nr:hypothetical protein NQ317_003233 [Molorchus minor]